MRSNKFNEALELIKSIPDAERNWEIDFYEVRTYHNLDDFNDTHLKFAIQCLNELQPEDIIPQIAFITEILTYYYRTSKNFDGMKYIPRGFELLSSLDHSQTTEKDKIFAADLLNNIAIIFSNTNQHEKAVEALEQRIEILKEINLPAHQSITYANLGYVYHSMGRIKQSLNVQLKALEISRVENNKRSIAIYLSNIGGNYAMLGDLELAEETLIESISISEEIDMQHLMCYSLSTLSSVYHKRGDFQTAMSYLDRAYKLQKNFNDSVLTLNVLYKEAEIKLEMGEIEDVKVIREELVELLTDEPPESKLHEFVLILDALILKQSKLYKNKLKAETIFRDFLASENIKNPRLQLQGFLNLSDLLLEQLQLEDREEETGFEEQEEEILKELQKILDVLHEKAILEESIDLQIQAQLLRAYLKLAEFKTDEAMDAFEQASFYSKISGIEAIAIHSPELDMTDEGSGSISSDYSSFNPEIVRSLDNIIHSIPRLEIILLLTQHGRLTYTELREMTGLTPGNLGRHCNKLVEVGYIFKDKEVVEDKFLTVYEMTPEGLNQFNRYSQILSPVLKPL